LEEDAQKDLTILFNNFVSVLRTGSLCSVYRNSATNFDFIALLVQVSYINFAIFDQRLYVGNDTRYGHIRTKERSL